MNDKEAREAAYEKYSNGDSMDVCLSRDSHESFEAGWDAALEHARGDWHPIRSAEDLPKGKGQYWVTNKDGRVMQDVFYAHNQAFRDGWLEIYIAYMPFDEPEPYQPQPTEGE